MLYEVITEIPEGQEDRPLLLLSRRGNERPGGAQAEKSRLREGVCPEGRLARMGLRRVSDGKDKVSEGDRGVRG